METNRLDWCSFWLMMPPILQGAQGDLGSNPHVSQFPPENLPLQAPSAACVGELPGAEETWRLKNTQQGRCQSSWRDNVSLKVVLTYWRVSQKTKNSPCAWAGCQSVSLWQRYWTTVWLTRYTWVGEWDWYLTRLARLHPASNPMLIGYQSRILLLMYIFGCLDDVMIITEGVTD